MFCPKCAAQIPDESLFCLRCGNAVTDQQTSTQNMDIPNRRKLTIFRESQMYLLNPPVNISINDKKDKSINNGETIVMELDEGHYVLEFSLHVRRTSIEIDLNKDMQITLKWDRFTGDLKAAVQ